MSILALSLGRNVVVRVDYSEEDPSPPSPGET